MRTNVGLLVLLCFGVALTACGGASGVAAQGGAPQTEDQKTLYALGQALGDNIKNAGLTEEEVGSVMLGLSDSALKRPSKVKMDEYGPKLQEFMAARMEKSAAGELTESQTFVEQQAKAPGATRTPTGIIIQEMKAGTGATPKPEDTVKVHYHGTLRDGTVFDSSVTRGEPATFPLNQVIPCWTEGVQHIKVGGKSKLTCPANLAYGPEGRPGIPGNAALVFEVELLEIVAAPK
jgi:FKBP-type peptidyl-prolyl cis-trans isomerase FkpA